jgi:3-deoxy-7-phosphoheptulonate synthase
VLREFPATPKAAETAFEARAAIHRILFGADDRLLVVIGPCSIHDTTRPWNTPAASRPRPAPQERPAGRDAGLFREAAHHGGLEGPDQRPHMDNSFRINDGLRLARKLLWEVNELGLPAGTEFLDMITPQYIADLISWGAIGARTTESQVHRELASGPVLPGGLQERHRRQHAHRRGRHQGRPVAAPLPVGDQGRPLGHRVHRRQRGLPRHPARRQGAQLRRRQRRRRLQASWPPPACAGKLMVDFSHANSRKQYKLQVEVARDVAGQMANRAKTASSA